MNDSRVPIRARYLSALGFLLLLGLVQAVMLVRLISDQELVGTTVNLAGRQRMLSQRIPSLARDIALGENVYVRAERRTALLAAIDAMAKSHAELIVGNAQIGPPGWPPSAARQLYFDPPVSLDAQVDDFIARARAFAQRPLESIRIDNPDLNYLIARRDAVLANEDRVVNAYVLDGQHRESRVVSFALVLFGLQVVLLALILAFLFVPMERQIESQRASLMSENTGLAAVVSGSQALAETLAVESLVARFVEGAERLLHVPVRLYGEGEHAAIRVQFDALIGTADAATRALIERSFATRRLEQSDDGRTLALGIDVFEGNPRLVLTAVSAVAFRRTEIAALELFATNLLLAAHNATLFRNLEEREARVAELDQLKSDLIAMLAHDFKGPLTSIIGYAELMREGIMEGKELDEAAGFIVDSAWRLSSLASDTLTMSLLERNELSLERRRVDIVELVRDAISGVEPGRLTFHTEIEQLEIDIDARRMRQVFDNLIGNALKYSPNGSPVEVSIAQVGGAVRISIADHGIGIPAAELDRVFERFARATNAKASGISGTGFGLYLTKMFVELHGGHIDVRSIEGSGSTFTVILAQSAAPALAEASPLFLA